jgi:hypothetical protein
MRKQVAKLVISLIVIPVVARAIQKRLFTQVDRHF